ncbi:hypothetical protein ACPPVS_02455 [Cellulomonas sp. McL0617]|uniref:hypothetical protein n=1 Tax=Cellulomonas sp. McL0617 TaxID=3415675 RepID=UPI003CF14036
MREPPEVRVARASAALELGADGSPVVGERRTTVRGGSTFQASGRRGGLAPLAGRGGGGAVRPPIAAGQPVEAVPGDQAFVPGARGVAVDAWVAPTSLDVDRRIAPPGGRPTVGRPAPVAPARLMVGTPFDQETPTPGALVPDAADPDALAPAALVPACALVARVALMFGVVLEVPDERESLGPAVLAAPEPELVTLRRTGAAADSAEVAPPLAVRMGTGDIARSA